MGGKNKKMVLRSWPLVGSGLCRSSQVKTPLSLLYTGIRNATTATSSSQPHIEQIPTDIPRLKELVLTYEERIPEETPANQVFVSDRSYFEAPVLNLKREQISTIQLDQTIFGSPLRSDIIYRCLVSCVLSRRNADGIKPTKIISTIRGSGAKIRPQKGSGRARLGHKRAAHLRKGQKAHGRVARDISIDLPPRVYQYGMRSLLSAKYALGQLVVLNELKMDSHKTADLENLLRSYNWGNKLLFVDHRVEPNTRMASRNLPDVHVSTLRATNVWDILKSEMLVMTPRAIDEVIKYYHPDEVIRKEMFQQEEIGMRKKE